MLKYFKEFGFLYYMLLQYMYYNCIFVKKKTPANIELHKNVFQTLYSDRFAFVFVDLFSIYYLFRLYPLAVPFYGFCLGYNK